VLLGDLRQTHTGATNINHLSPIYIQPRSPDLPTFQLCPAHARPDTFDDDAPF
jgi:hypothetical protein